MFKGVSAVATATFLLSIAAVTAGGAQDRFHLFDAPQHPVPSFARPDINARPLATPSAPPAPKTPGRVLRELLLSSPAEADTPAKPGNEAVASEAVPSPPVSPPSIGAPSAREKNRHVQEASRPRKMISAPRRSPVGSRTATAGRRLGTVRAAWYQHPGRTASGERFNPEGRTAAHKTLPLGMRLRVINPQNGRSIAVRINDRVPSTAKYPLDLSRGSARALGIKSVAAVALYQAR
jgi:hypothetical protein